MSVSHVTKRNGKAPRDAQLAAQRLVHTTGVDAALDRWMDRLERPAVRPLRPGAPVAPRPSMSLDVDGKRAASVREALSRIVVEGSTVRFGDAMGGDVVLSRNGTRTSHRGTVAVRGALGDVGTLLEPHGLTPAQVLGVEFVASWFGAPFDAVTASRQEGRVLLEWGAWPFSASEIPRVLGAWKERAPERFAGMLGDYGVDVTAGEDLGGPSLAVLDTRGRLLRDDRAVDLLASDPRRLALLARVGRDAGARAAQVAHVVTAVLRPLLRMEVKRGEARAPMASLFVSARAVAALLCATRGLDAAACEEVLRVAVADSSETGEAAASEAAALEALARYLRVSGHTASAHDVRRTMSSPELSIAAPEVARDNAVQER